MSAGNHAALLMEHRFLGIFTARLRVRKEAKVGIVAFSRSAGATKEQKSAPAATWTYTQTCVVHFANCLAKPQTSQFSNAWSGIISTSCVDFFLISEERH